ncbi:MAG: zeta toxin family protein [Tannerella sp.]|nr:zeta toxin family protein [Tannerella sp.]
MIGDRRISLRPVVILLGGQLASGKSKLTAVAEREHSGCSGTVYV